MTLDNANARQVAGTHYASADGVQHWDLIDTYRVGYLEGCASKYVTRWRRKNGVQDLQKAEHYLQKLYQVRAGLSFQEQLERRPDVPAAAVLEFARANGCGAEEERILGLILRWESTHTIDLARRAVLALIAAGSNDGAEPGRGYVNQD